MLWLELSPHFPGSTIDFYHGIQFNKVNMVKPRKEHSRFGLWTPGISECPTVFTTCSHADPTRATLYRWMWLAWWLDSCNQLGGLQGNEH